MSGGKRNHRVSASSVWLTQYCLAWARPDWADPPEMKANPKMEKGNRIHALVETLHGKLDLPEGVNATELACAKSAVGYMSRLSAVALEVPLAWDWETGATRILPSEYHRDYRAAGETEIPGTADMVGKLDGVLQLVDWKTGLSKWPNYGPQIRFLGTVAAVFNGDPEVECAIVKLSPKDAAVGERYRLDLFDMAAEQDDLATRMRGLATAEPQPGEHCRWCNSRSLCPAFTQQESA